MLSSKCSHSSTLFYASILQKKGHSSSKNQFKFDQHTTINRSNTHYYSGVQYNRKPESHIIFISTYQLALEKTQDKTLQLRSDSKSKVRFKRRQKTFNYNTHLFILVVRITMRIQSTSQLQYNSNTAKARILLPSTSPLYYITKDLRPLNRNYPHN